MIINTSPSVDGEVLVIDDNNVASTMCGGVRGGEGMKVVQNH